MAGGRHDRRAITECGWERILDQHTRYADAAYFGTTAAVPCQRGPRSNARATPGGWVHAVSVPMGLDREEVGELVSGLPARVTRAERVQLCGAWCLLVWAPELPTK